MKLHLLNILSCPECRGSLELTEAQEVAGEIESGKLACGACRQIYPIIRYVPRFVPLKNYADSFGLQWNEFRQVQLDSYSGLAISAERFFQSTGWPRGDLAGKTVLDVGCGSGRFAEVALSCGAELVALDYSAAVEACRQNLGSHPRIDIVQGDIYKLPFKPASFDFVYCLGVLQHTPDVPRAFKALPGQVKAGGGLAVDVYPKFWRNYLWPKYWLRPLTKRMNPPELLRLVKSMVRWLLPISRSVGRLPFLSKLRYALPVVNYEGVYPLSQAQLEEWSILDTFDMLAPAYDYPQSDKTILAWFQEAGFRDIEVFRRGVYVGRGKKPVN